jgi:trans-AT polyketide synthase/acyltransferase/oxidoreductase domain-containing protein
MRGMRTALVFPGQGSQTRGMGADLFDAFPDLLRTADDILGYSLRELCVNDPRGELTRTQFTQPALFAVEALQAIKGMADRAQPDFAAGHSLGEYAALFAAGVFDFATGLRLVQKRGALMAEAPAGGMAAVIGMPEPAIREVLAAAGFAGIDIANDNAPSQVVLAGLKQDIAAAQTALEAAGARYVVLNVGAAFHSRYMRPAQAEFERFLADAALAAPAFPVISNVTARPHTQDAIRRRLVEQIASPVKWTETVRFLMGQGVEHYDEIGPGQVLTRLIAQIRKEASPLIAAPDDVPPPPTEPAALPPPPAAPPRSGGNGGLSASGLGAPGFREAYGTRYAYVGGSLMHGVASAEQVIALGQAGFLGIYGADGVPDATVAADLARIRAALGGKPFGASLTADWTHPGRDTARVELFLRAGVPVLEVSGFLTASPALVRYRLDGLTADRSGNIVPRHRILARVTRPQAAQFFLEPPPRTLVDALRNDQVVSAEAAELARRVPLADDLCAQADGGGPTDGANLLNLLPSLCRLRDECQAASGLAWTTRVGAAGGLGTPEALAAAFMLGADFVLASSIHQCSPEAGTSGLVKEMLATIDVGDTEHAPSGELFEQNGQIQVLRRGVFFPARAAKLHSLWRHHPGLDSIDSQTRRQVEEKILGDGFDAAWNRIGRQLAAADPAALERAERDPKARMALVFRSYFTSSLRNALTGDGGQRVNFQVHCSPAVGALNRWLGNLPWQQRRVADIAGRLMDETARLLDSRRSVLWPSH